MNWYVLKTPLSLPGQGKQGVTHPLFKRRKSRGKEEKVSEIHWFKCTLLPLISTGTRGRKYLLLFSYSTMHPQENSWQCFAFGKGHNEQIKTKTANIETSQEEKRAIIQFIVCLRSRRRLQIVVFSTLKN